MRILAIFLTVFFGYVPQSWAASCAVEISGSDSMMFDAKEINVGSECTDFATHINPHGRTAGKHHGTQCRYSERGGF